MARSDDVQHEGNEPGWRQRAVSKSLSAARTRAEQRVQGLLDAAFALIDERGTTEFTIQEVVDRSKQSLRGFYQYFEGKDELLFALLEESVRESLEDLAIGRGVRVRAARAPARLHDPSPRVVRASRDAPQARRLTTASRSRSSRCSSRSRIPSAWPRDGADLADADRAAQSRGGGRIRAGVRTAASRSAHPADRHVRLAHEPLRSEAPGTGHGRGYLGVLPPRPRRLTRIQNRDLERVEAGREAC